MSGVLLVTASLKSWWTSSLLWAIVFIVTRALKTVSDRYVVLNEGITLVTTCLATLGATARPLTIQNV